MIIENEVIQLFKFQTLQLVHLYYNEHMSENTKVNHFIIFIAFRIISFI
jgi:hypothetical protein